MTTGDEPSVGHIPAFQQTAFDCPYCGAYAHQNWASVYYAISGSSSYAHYELARFSQCSRCREFGWWRGREMIYPGERFGPQPHEDMPGSVRALYEEAREVGTVSKRSAAALLRLALQILIDEIEPGSGSINDKVAALVRSGLDPQVQQAMDTVRIVGNNAVHPGQIDLDDEPEWVPVLFVLLNLIVEQVVSRPRQVADLFAALPATAQAQVARRDQPQQ